MKKSVIILFLFSLCVLQAQNAVISGKVTDADRKPLFGVNVTIDTRNTGVQTDMDGNYTIDAQEGDIIRFSYLGLQTIRVKVNGQRQIFVQLLEDQSQLDPVVVSYSGIPKERKKAPYAITSIKGTEVESNGEPDLLRNIAGKVPGARIIATSGASGAGTNMIIRGQSSITGNNQPLIVVDGVPFNNSTNAIGGLGGGGVMTTNRLLDLDPNNIARVEVLKGLSASVLYGQLGRNGVILITTKTGYYGDAKDLVEMPYTDNRWQAQEEVRQALASERTAKELGFKSRYQNILRYLAGADNRIEIFRKYIPLLGNDAGFYIDVYDRFIRSDPSLGTEVLRAAKDSNIEDPVALRTLAFKMEAAGRYDLAADLYQRTLQIEPTSYPTRRHLALAWGAMGKQQKAVDELSRLYNEIADSNESLAKIVSTDIMDLSATYNRPIVDGPVEDIEGNTHDLRVVVDWNREEVNLDMQLIDPDLEIASSMTPVTNSGGKIVGNNGPSNGPLTYVHKGYLPGSYYLKVVYTSREIMENPDGLYIKLNVYRGYGTGKPQKEVKVIRLKGKTKLELIDRIAIL